jgi:hypothetical protein
MNKHPLYNGFKKYELDMLNDGARNIQGFPIHYLIDGHRFFSKRSKDVYMRNRENQSILDNPYLAMEHARNGR